MKWIKTSAGEVSEDVLQFDKFLIKEIFKSKLNELKDE